MAEKIYALMCNEKPFYVGKTERSLKQRLIEHMRDVKDGVISKKCDYIRKGITDAATITIEELLDVASEFEAIINYEAAGFVLTNSKNGDYRDSYDYEKKHIGTDLTIKELHRAKWNRNYQDKNFLTRVNGWLIWYGRPYAYGSYKVRMSDDTRNYTSIGELYSITDIKKWCVEKSHLE